MPTKKKKQSRPSGPAYPIDADWKATVLKTLTAMGTNKSAMAREIGVSTTTMVELFRAKSQQSRLVPRIHEFLGWPPPESASPGDGAHSELAEIERRLPPEKKALLIALARQLDPKNEK